MNVPPVRAPTISGEAFCDNCGAALQGSPFSWKVNQTVIKNVIGLDVKPQHSKDEVTLKMWMLQHGAVEDGPSTNFETDSTSEVPRSHLPHLLCPTCSSSNTAEAIACITCGTSLNSEPKPVDYYCSQCHKKISVGNRFCGGCGSLLSTFQCPKCQTLNDLKKTQCIACHCAATNTRVFYKELTSHCQ